MQIYKTPVLKVIALSDLPSIVFAQTGGFTFMLTNIANNCCEINAPFCVNEEGSRIPEGVGIPGTIEVSNGTFTIQINGGDRCTVSGPIAGDGSINFDPETLCFEDNPCPDFNPDCCTQINTYHLEGSFDGEHLVLHVSIHKNYDQNNPSCTIGPVTVIDCTDTGDIIADKN